MKVSIHQEDLKIINIDAPQNRAPTYMKQKLTQREREMNKSVIIVGIFSTPYSVMVRTAGQKINKEKGNLNNTVIQLY